MQVNESPDSYDVARKCVVMIAEHRKSAALRRFLDTGELGDTEMDPAQAYARLDISDRTIDDDAIKAAYQLAITDTPGQRPELEKALASIAKDRDSALLMSMISNDRWDGEHELSEWPVGLENIGNTCYLNSLLQFYFTIRPLRELVLHFEEHKMEISSGAFARKQVGSRQVSKKEVQRAQRFVYELRKLFQDMIKSDRPQVIPEQELARLTLLSSSTEEIFRRRSTLTGPRPALGEINGQIVQGPLPPPTIPEHTKESPEDSGPPSQKTEGSSDDKLNGDAIVIDDNSSDGTLVEKPQSPPDTDLMVLDSPLEVEQQQVFEDKENLAPTKEEDARPSTPDKGMQPLAEASPSRINEQRASKSPPKSSIVGNADQAPDQPPPSRIPGPPNRPPPVPPRDKKPVNKEEIQRELEFGAQQDVTEAISNVLFQLSCAIEGEGVDSEGEQVDTIKQLFFGKQKTVTTDKDGRARTKEELFSDIKVQVAGPRDIYDALDSAFDEEEVDVGDAKERQYTTISVLPPILQIHIARAQYDKEKAALFKSNHHLEFPPVVFMDRYVDAPEDADLQQRRSESWAWKRELARLEKQEAALANTSVGVDLPDALRSMASYLTQLATPEDSSGDIPADSAADMMDTSVGTDATPPSDGAPPSAPSDEAPAGPQEDDSHMDHNRPNPKNSLDEPISVPPNLVARLDAAAAAAAERRTDLAARIQTLRTHIGSQFADRRRLAYRLHAVFIHRGLATSGHYWIYIFDFARAVWRKYNDGYVTAMPDTHEIFATEPGVRPATSSFLVYVREGAETRLTDAVRREPAEARPQGTEAERPGPGLGPAMGAPHDAVMTVDDDGAARPNGGPAEPWPAVERPGTPGAPSTGAERPQSWVEEKAPAPEAQRPVAW